MQKTKKFTDLIVWQKSYKVILEVYKISSSFPKEEIYGLTSQLRRAAISIPANIAEGYIKKGIKDKARYFNISQGSLEELKYYLILIDDLKYCYTSKIKIMADEVGKLLNGYLKGILNNNF